jgi:O-methyltransferase
MKQSIVGGIKQAIKLGLNLMGVYVARLPKGYKISGYRPNPFAGKTIQPWLEDEKTVSFFKQSQGYTCLTVESLYILMGWLNYALVLPGNVAEFGVYKGGSAILLAKKLMQSAPDKTLHLFDTFQGMPETDFSKDNYYQKGDFNDTSLTQVKNLFKEIDTQVKFHVGTFQETAHAVEDEKFCFAHVDADIYSAVKFATEFLYPRMVCGGAIVYDDYGWKDCAGAKLAVDEFYADKPERPVYMTTSQCLVIKR